MRRVARSITGDVAEVSHPGQDPEKQVNEDCSGSAATPHGLLGVVCDGMGGHSDGQQASQTAVRTIIQTLSRVPAGVSPRDALAQSLHAAATAVYAVGAGAAAGVRPGSTCVAVLLHEEGAEIAHVGDSRAYLVRGGAVRQITDDHSVVRGLVNAGVITEREARHHPEANKITRALGMSETVDIETRPSPMAIQPGDILLLCTDGLSDLVDTDDMTQELEKHLPAGADVACQKLVDLANTRGGHDNITVQLVTVIDAPPMSLTEPPPTTLVAPPGHTLLIETPKERAILPTVPDEFVPRTIEETPGPAPTIVDRGPPSPTVIDPHPPGPRPRQPSLLPAGKQGRILLAAGTLVAFGIVVAVLLWWLAALLGGE